MKRQAGLAGALASVLMTCVARADVQIVSDRGRELSALYPHLSVTSKLHSYRRFAISLAVANRFSHKQASVAPAG